MGEAVCQGMEDGDIDGPDASVCRVFISPGLEEAPEMKDVVGAIQLLGIWEAQLVNSCPQYGGLPPHVELVAARKEPMVVATGKDDEEVNVCVRGEGGRGHHRERVFGQGTW